MPVLPMFPLGSVLFPHMPLPLRVFEPRYLALLRDVLPEEPAEFGVVLIERGSEVGGGDARVGVGTVARITQLDTSDQSVLLIAQGDRRVEVTRWLDDDPYPRAEVRDLPDPTWSDDLQPLRDRAEQAVRHLLRSTAEEGTSPWPPEVGLDDDPAAACWQLAAIAPVGPIDQLGLLRQATLRGLLSETVELVTAAQELWDATS